MRDYADTVAQRKEPCSPSTVAMEPQTLDEFQQRLADRITHVLVDMIVNEIIRPGPTAEERECYDVADELRALRPKLTELVRQVIKVEGAISQR